MSGDYKYFSIFWLHLLDERAGLVEYRFLNFSLTNADILFEVSASVSVLVIILSPEPPISLAFPKALPLHMHIDRHKTGRGYAEKRNDPSMIHETG